MNIYIYMCMYGCSKDQHIYIYVHIHTLVKHQRTFLLQQTEKNVHLITWSHVHSASARWLRSRQKFIWQSHNQPWSRLWLWPIHFGGLKFFHIINKTNLWFVLRWHSWWYLRNVPFLTIKQHLEMSQRIHDFFYFWNCNFEESHPSWFSRVVKVVEPFLCPFKDRCFDTALICAML